MATKPIKAGLFHIPESSSDIPYLIGSRCQVCGYISFPNRKACVKCRKNNVTEEIKLGPYGKLETFAVMQVGPPDYPPPYVIGYVRMREGAQVFAQILIGDMADEALKIGQEMELVIDVLKTDAEGNKMLGWKFKPIETKQ